MEKILNKQTIIDTDFLWKQWTTLLKEVLNNYWIGYYQASECNLVVNPT